MDLSAPKAVALWQETGPACLLAAGIGVLSHLLYWIHGIRDTQAPQIVIFHLLVYFAMSAKTIGNHGLRGVGDSSAIFLSYIGALFTSIMIYRLFFHPLRRFPGPFWAKVTKAYSGPWIARKGKLHEVHLEWCQEYGSIVRSGPNELILLTTDAIEKVHGGHSKCDKRGTRAEWFKFRGAPNLDSIIQKEPHRWRRQVWEKAFTKKSLDSYEVYIRQVVRDWFNQIPLAKGELVDFSLYAALIPIDLIGKVAFSRDFGCVKDGHDHGIVMRLESLFRFMAIMGHLYWPVALWTAWFPSKEYLEFEKLVITVMDERLQSGDENSADISKHFIEDYQADKPKTYMDKMSLYADGQGAFIGGIPTLHSSLTSTISNLVQTPHAMQKLVEELAPAFGKTVPGEFADQDLVGIEYLDAVITEALRIAPPGGSNAPRTTPPEGIEVDGVYIPGNVRVFTPNFAFGRSEKFWVKPNQFIPERWTTRPDLILDRKANFPFYKGPFNCVGKKYALMVLRLIVAETVWNYILEFPPNEDQSRTQKESKNVLVVRPGSLNLVFTKRT